MSWKKMIIFGAMAIVLIPAYIVMLLIVESWIGRVLVILFTLISIPALFRKDPEEPQNEK
jgi:hypothetical protein